MIDNYQEIFEDYDSTISNDNQKKCHDRKLSLNTVDFEKREGNVYTAPQTLSENTSSPSKKLFRKFTPSICLERMLPSPFLEMLSIIAEKGQESDEIFRCLLKKPHWSLRDKIYTEQPVDLNEESVLIIASVVKDFIRKIPGSLMCFDLYENWLRVSDEASLVGKVHAIQSILLKMPQHNYWLLKELMSVLVKIKTSSKNHLDTYMLSLRIAPHMFWDPTCNNSLFGSDLPQKMTIIQIMIDKYQELFEDHDIPICKENQSRSDDVKVSLNTAGDSGTPSTYHVPQQKHPHD
ncbi:rho GTPase-activating protein 20-like isoform X2 [Grammomys surdaster]|uniref:rho GTPase-activating protein 20-like isoform X2 n=1 Tax=Grammomys surdaster TaxID=491861 RepID=UPI00109FDBEC|nr:rho GTPase-activating protein 20-like isoform X2 [Grammomys surdaster]